MNKLKGFNIIKKLKQKIGKSKELTKEINNFETNIEPLICKSCKVKLRRVKGGNILQIVSKQNYFCKTCNDIIAKKATEIFTKI